MEAILFSALRAVESVLKNVSVALVGFRTMKAAGAGRLF
jgi:hypothetical protein